MQRGNFFSVESFSFACVVPRAIPFQTLSWIILKLWLLSEGNAKQDIQEIDQKFRASNVKSIHANSGLIIQGVKFVGTAWSILGAVK